MELLNALGARFGVELRPRVFLEHPSLAALAHHLLTSTAPPNEALLISAEEVASYASSLSYGSDLQVSSPLKNASGIYPADVHLSTHVPYENRLTYNWQQSLLPLLMTGGISCAGRW
jgi:hypothetical protein